MKDWINDQFTKRVVEPHSGLGKALNYLLKHWDGLTLFLRQAGAPLDNNIAERALKRAILHRKNSMFYKTPKRGRGGRHLHEPDSYLPALPRQSVRLSAGLHKNASQVLAQAALWLPWNYHEQLTGAP
jgi:transposase